MPIKLITSTKFVLPIKSVLLLKFVLPTKLVIPVQSLSPVKTGTGIQLKNIINLILLNINFQIRRYSLFAIFIVFLLFSIEAYSNEREVDEGEAILRMSEEIGNVSEEIENTSGEIRRITEEVQSTTEEIQSTTEEIQSTAERIKSTTGKIRQITGETTENSGGITKSPGQTEAGSSCVGSDCVQPLLDFGRADFRRVTQNCLNSLPKYCEGISTNLTKCAPDSLAIVPDKYKYGSDTYVDEAAACFSGLLVGLWDSGAFAAKAIYSPVKLVMDEKYREEAWNSLSFYAEQMITDPVEALKELLLSPIMADIDEFANCLNWSGRWAYFCEVGAQSALGYKVFQTAKKVKPKTPRRKKSGAMSPAYIRHKIGDLDRDIKYVQEEKNKILQSQRETLDKLDNTRISDKAERMALRNYYDSLVTDFNIRNSQHRELISDRDRLKDLLNVKEDK